MDIDHFLGVSFKVNIKSEIGRFGFIVRVGGIRLHRNSSRCETLLAALSGCCLERHVRGEGLLSLKEPPGFSATQYCIGLVTVGYMYQS